MKVGWKCLNIPSCYKYQISLNLSMLYRPQGQQKIRDHEKLNLMNFIKKLETEESKNFHQKSLILNSWRCRTQPLRTFNVNRDLTTFTQTPFPLSHIPTVNNPFKAYMKPSTFPLRNIPPSAPANNPTKSLLNNSSPSHNFLPFHCSTNSRNVNNSIKLNFHICEEIARRVHNPSTFRSPVRFSGRHFVNNFYVSSSSIDCTLCNTRRVCPPPVQKRKKETKECPVAFWFWSSLSAKTRFLLAIASLERIFGAFLSWHNPWAERGGSVNPREVRRRCERISREKRRKQAIETKTKQRWWKQQSSARGRRTASEKRHLELEMWVEESDERRATSCAI